MLVTSYFEILFYAIMLGIFICFLFYFIIDDIIFKRKLAKEKSKELKLKVRN